MTDKIERDTAIGAKQRFRDAYGDTEGIVTLGVAKRHGQHVIRVGVVDEDMAALFPTEFDGYPVVVEYEEPLTPRRTDYHEHTDPPEPEDPERQSERRPFPPGVEISGESSGACSSGFLLRDPSTGTDYMSTNWHCTDHVGEQIHQPGFGPRVGEIADRVEINLGGSGNYVDLAWIAIDDDVDYTPSIYGFDPLLTDEHHDPEIGDSITNIGRTTGVTHGEISEIAVDARIDYGDGTTTVLHDQIRHDPADMTAGGDSGSPFVHVATVDGEEVAYPLGLNYAGSVLCPIWSVESESGLRIVPERTGEEPVTDPSCVRSFLDP